MFEKKRIMDKWSKCFMDAPHQTRYNSEIKAASRIQISKNNKRVNDRAAHE